jgi:hypothetical protein
MTTPSQRKKMKMSKIDKAIMFAPIFATGVGLGAKKIYDFYKSNQNEKIRTKINERIPIIRQKLEDFKMNKNLQVQEIQKSKEQKMFEDEEIRSGLEKARQQNVLEQQQKDLENQKRKNLEQQQQKDRDDLEKQKRKILEQKLIEELKKKQIERERKLEEEKKFIEDYKILLDQQQAKIQEMNAQKEFLEEMKYHSIALLKELRKTNKDINLVDQLIQNIPENSDYAFTIQVCKVYSNIKKKSYDECDKPYVQDFQGCIRRTNIKYNINPDIVNSALSKLNCK